ncbi:MAG TPA: DUF1579 domain-containing protein [Planctomycetota bacterium]|nr:DUF1579 domain-containing protein [Planctomycetota bacterium]
MKRKSIFLMAAALVGAFLLGRAGAQEGADPMAQWMELAKPGPEHAKLMKCVGNWTVDGKMWMQPGAEPMLTTGKAVFSSVFGDRFLKQEYDGKFQGMPDLGIGYTGYNNATKKYESLWICNMSTGVMLMTGTETEPGTCEFEGTCCGPDGQDMKHRLVLKHVDNDKQILEMFCTQGDGPEAKMMELTYTRVK